MDFTPTEAQGEARDLAARIFGDLSTHERLKEAGQRVVHTGQHLLGGAGADLDHPVHRRFLRGRPLVAHLGSGAEVLQELGELTASGE